MSPKSVAQNLRTTKLVLDRVSNLSLRGKRNESVQQVSTLLNLILEGNFYQASVDALVLAGHSESDALEMASMAVRTLQQEGAV